MSEIFGLAEYDDVARQFFTDAVRAVARAESPLLSLPQVEHLEAVPPSRITLDTGEIVDGHVIETASTLLFSVDEGITGTFDDFHAAVANTAVEYASTVTGQMIEQVSQLCDATGNTIDRAGRSVWDSMLEALETIHITFDEDGQPSLPQIVMHPSTWAKLGPEPEGARAKWDEIIARRRYEWMAGRRTRRLPRHRDGEGV